MSISKQNLEVLVSDTIASSLGVERASIRLDSDLEEELGFDSTEMIGAIVELERALKVSLKSIDYTKLKTPADLVEAILDAMPA